MLQLLRDWLFKACGWVFSDFFDQSAYISCKQCVSGKKQLVLKISEQYYQCQNGCGYMSCSLTHENVVALMMENKGLMGEHDDSK
jgi:hypothetical protein